MYGRHFISFVSFSLLFTILFCYIVDPYSLYGRYSLLDGVEVNSPGFSAQIRMGKAMAIKQRKPQVLIMGSSRSDYGISSQSVEQFYAKDKMYNASFPGGNAYEMLRYFQHAVATSHIQQVYIGFDFFQFHAGRPVESNFSEEQLIVDIDNQPSGSTIDDFVLTLLSADSAYYSIKVFTGLCRWDDIYLPNGFKLQDHSGASLQEFIDSERKYINKTYTSPEFTFIAPNASSTHFDYFRKFIQLAYEKQINLHVFISPSHARQWEVIAELGLWEKWEYWKRQMLTITEQESSHYNQAAFPIHDFSGYNIYSTETVPRTSNKAMRWYSDSSHYRHELGEVILNMIIKDSGKNSFGRIINAQNINAHLKTIKEEHLQYALSHAKDIADIKDLIANRERKLY